MKTQILPNWCKKLGLTIFFVGSIIGGSDDFLGGFYDGLNGLPYKSTPGSSYFSRMLGESWLHFFEIIGILGMLIYMISKEKIEDDYIHKLRFESYKLSSIIWLLAAILIYAFNENFKLSIDYFIFLFIWTYLITFFIKKRIY